jgi:hypothetical protein
VLLDTDSKRRGDECALRFGREAMHKAGATDLERNAAQLIGDNPEKVTACRWR